MNRRGVLRAAALGIAGVVLAGCVNLPSGGSLGGVNPLPNLERSQILITPRGPGIGWQQLDIVKGFLTASGADLAIAREYLTGKYARDWHPSQTTPRVIDTGFKVASAPPLPQRVTGGQSQGEVTVTSSHLENFVPAGTSEAGRLQVSSAPGPYVFRFGLIQIRGGQWRINSITNLNGKVSSSVWLITDADFQRNYQPRNLYYLSSVSPGFLVPYPVYIPVGLGLLGSVRQLVEAVRSVPPAGSNWLYNAVRTAFPPGTTISAQVHANQAVVTLGGTAATVAPQTLGQMEAELIWTLTYAPDSAGTGIGFIHLQVGSRSMDLYPSQFTRSIPTGPSWPLYYQTVDRLGVPLLESFSPDAHPSPATVDKSDTAKTPGRAATGISPVQLPSGVGHGPFSAIAISPAVPGTPANYFGGCRGRTVYVGPLLLDSESQQRSLPAPCTSLSWDNQNDLWVVAGGDVYVVTSKPTGLQFVIIPNQQVIASDSFVSLKVAPDGVRVAMIVRTKNGTSVYVSAITKQKNSPVIYLAQGGPVLTVGPDLVNPIALSWWDSDHLLVLDRRHDVSQLHLVPLTGGESSKLPTPQDAMSLAANGTDVAVAVPASAGQGEPTVDVSRGAEGALGLWTPVANGSTPTYGGL